MTERNFRLEAFESDFDTVTLPAMRDRPLLRGVGTAPKGTPLTYIRHKGTQRLFAWCYVDASRVPGVIANLVKNWRETDLDCNFHSHASRCCAS